MRRQREGRAAIGEIDAHGSDGQPHVPLSNVRLKHDKL